MNIAEIIIYILIIFMILGALDKIFGNKFGLGEKFDDGFHALGPLAIAMVGIISFAPVLANLLKPIIGPIYAFFGADPAMFATTFLAIDMGGYPLAVQLARTPEVGLFAGIILGSLLGATIIFTIPVALGIIKKEDYKFLALGILIGLITIPLGCIAGGLTAGLKLQIILVNLIPVIIFSFIIFLGLWLIPKFFITAFNWFSKGVMIVITLSTVAIVIETLTNIVIIPGMAPIWDGFKMVGSIAIVLLGAFPLVHVIITILKKPLTKFGNYFGINDAATAGLIITLANNIPMLNILKKMDDKGKVLNISFAVGASFVLGDHLGFTAAVSPKMILPMIVGKLTAGILALIFANLLISKTRILKNLK